MKEKPDRIENFFDKESTQAIILYGILSFIVLAILWVAWVTYTVLQ